MASLLWQRDLGGDVDGVKHTFSSWDACMSKSYCKWPVIIVIIVGSLIALSLIWCLARCLCCGMECCCGCLSCCNACCPSPRRRNHNHGYQQAPPTPYQNQYQPSAPPLYQPSPAFASGGMGYRSANVPQTATFDAPSKSGEKYNEDALPAMPSWGAATSRREEVHDDLELEKLDHTGHLSPQQETLLSQQESGRYYGGGARTGAQDLSHTGDMGNMSANPYHDYQQRQNFSPSPYGSQNHGAPSPYSPAYQQPTPHGGPAAGYFDGHQQQHQYGGQQRSYQPSIPPSYHTQAPSDIVSPISPQGGSQAQYPGQPAYQAYGGVGRKPVQGSWREV